MRVATWNVNGIRARERQFLEWLDVARPDLICLQEIKASKSQIPMTIWELEGYSCYWHGGGGYSGVALHVCKDFFADKPEFTHPDFDYESRVVMTNLGGLIIASIYVPNGGKDFEAKMRFLDSLENFVDGTISSGNQLILCGDFNVARTDRDVHPKERRPNAIGQLPVEREVFERILGRGLVDTMRMLHPDDDQLFTWWAPWRNMKQRNIGWRLDYILASGSLAQKASECSVYRETGTSDHAPVIATFNL